MQSPTLTHCITCGAPIYWVETEQGRKMPVDSRPQPDGNIIFIDQKAHVIGKEEPVGENVNRWVSHFATCPHAKIHRRIVSRLKRKNVKA